MATSTDDPRPDGPTAPQPAGQHPLDRLAVTGIRAFGHHGVLDHERRDGQWFLADVVLHLDTRPAASSDDLHDTVDYGNLVQSVVAAIGSDPVDLIETLAERIADLCLKDSRVVRTEVTLHKPDAPIAAPFADVTLTITRSRSASSTPSSTRHLPSTAQAGLPRHDRRSAP